MELALQPESPQTYVPGVVIADNYPLVVLGIKEVLRPHYDVRASFSSVRTVADHVSQLRPDIVILGISPSGTDDLLAGRAIRKLLPVVKLIFLTMDSDSMLQRMAISAGADGVVSKAAPAEELLEAVRRVLIGDTYITGSLPPDATENLSSIDTVDAGIWLTERQGEILRLITDGRSGKEIAGMLEISLKTVEFHKARLKAKFGAHSTTELVRIALEKNLVPKIETAAERTFESADNAKHRLGCGECERLTDAYRRTVKLYRAAVESTRGACPNDALLGVQIMNALRRRCAEAGEQCLQHWKNQHS